MVRVLGTVMPLAEYTGCRRVETQHNSRARWITQHGWAVRVGEGHPAFRKPVHVRCFGLDVAAQDTHPVVQIVDGNKKYITEIVMNDFVLPPKK